MNFGSLLSTTEQRHTFNTERLQAQLLGKHEYIHRYAPTKSWKSLSDDSSKRHADGGFGSVFNRTDWALQIKQPHEKFSPTRASEQRRARTECHLLEKTSPQLENFGFNDLTQTLINIYVSRVEMSAAVFHDKKRLLLWPSGSRCRRLKKFQLAKKISKLLWLDPNWTRQLWLQIQVKSPSLQIRVLLLHLTLKQPFYSAASNSYRWSAGECKCCGRSADLQILLTDTTAINCC